MIDYGKNEWQQTLSDLEKAPDVVTDVLREFDFVWYAKGLIIQCVPNIFIFILRRRLNPWFNLLSFMDNPNCLIVYANNLCIAGPHPQVWFPAKTKRSFASSG